ncbi:hypothetical protein VTN31DRAFT_3924 [Thermomyces dupontii]|uniref:D-aspartate oxidase n=1 Tax=Talaromyces thermophilus TaxID=28565 RepID=OXDD_TALTH
MPPRIIILGAGIIGLSTAVELQQRHQHRSAEPRPSITIVSAELPSQPSEWTEDPRCRPSPDYASMWAGAHYRPIPGATPQLQREAQWAMDTFRRMRRIARDAPEAGVRMMPGIEYLEDSPKEYGRLRTGDRYAGEHDEFRVLDKAELPEGVAWGCRYQTYSLNAPHYSRWLLDRFLAGGGQIVHRKLERLEEAFTLFEDGSQPLVINCTGRNFDQDDKMRIIRGQTVLVRNQFDRTITRQNRDGSWIFLIPRPFAGTIIGGTKEPGDMEVKPRMETRLKLLENCVRAFPEFVDRLEDFDVVLDNVGRRPWRDGGLRLEEERIEDGKTVIHAYGAGGRGYELSWGIAKEVADLVLATERSKFECRVSENLK